MSRHRTDGSCPACETLDPLDVEAATIVTNILRALATTIHGAREILRTCGEVPEALEAGVRALPEPLALLVEEELAGKALGVVTPIERRWAAAHGREATGARRPPYRVQVLRAASDAKPGTFDVRLLIYPDRAYLTGAPHASDRSD